MVIYINMFRFLITFFCSFCAFALSQQTLEVNFDKKFNWNGDYFIGLDKFDDLYYLKNNVLFKVNDNQNWQFKDYNLGEIHFVDITNPLQILVFYKNFQSIVILDNQLNEIRRTAINPEENFFIKHISLSIQNKMWFYDEKFQRFGLFDMQKSHWSSFPYVIKNNPISFFSSLNNLYWLDENNNLFEMSIFGQVNKLVNFDQNTFVHAVNDLTIIFEKNKKFFQMNYKKDEVLEIKIPLEKFEKIMFKKQKMFIFTDTNFYLYTLK